mgnify:CR=1 FL=1
MTEIRRAPPSVGKLDKFVLAHAKIIGTVFERVRQSITYMVLSGALERAAREPNGPTFVVKGGVALELRLPGRARATKDIDIVAICESDDLVAALDQALSAPYCNFTFTRRPDTKELGDKATRVWVQIDYQSQRWTTIQVDLAKSEGPKTETEQIPGISLDPFGLQSPDFVSCISLRYHIAQKIHGMTKAPYDGSENDRFRDAVDLLLLEELISLEELPAVCEACEETFRIRKEHAWPPDITLPISWEMPLVTMANELELDVDSLEETQLRLHRFVQSIVQATGNNSTMSDTSNGN